MAVMLGYSGLVMGFDITSAGTGITAAAADNAYFEYKLGPGDAVPRMKYALMSALDSTRASVPSATTGIRTVRPATKLGFELRVPYSDTPGHSRITTRVAKKAGAKKQSAGLTGFHFFHQR
jgi:hypothetical protein